MPAIDDGRQIKIYPGSEELTNGVIIGSTATATQRLLTLAQNIDASAPSVKGYVDVDGNATLSGTITATGGLVSPAIPATVGTAPSGTGITVNSSGAVQHVVHKVTADYTAFQAASTTKDVTLWTLPAKTRVLRVIAHVTTAFAGGAITAVVLRVGKAANGAGYLLDADVFSADDVFGDVAAEIGANLLSATVADVAMTTTQIVNARLTSTTADLSELTQGSLTLYIECCVYP